MGTTRTSALDERRRRPFAEVSYSLRRPRRAGDVRPASRRREKFPGASQRHRVTRTPAAQRWRVGSHRARYYPKARRPAGQPRSTESAGSAAHLARLPDLVQRRQCGNDPFDLEAARPEIEGQRPDRVGIRVRTLEHVLQCLLLLTALSGERLNLVDGGTNRGSPRPKLPPRRIVDLWGHRGRMRAI